MNFLAHIYLSGENEKVAIGNFFADSIRGNKYRDFPKDYQIGILLHRAIDSFTDAHPIFRQSTKRLHNGYSHYSGVIVDIFYDHFLAKNWHFYSDVELETFSMDFYRTLEENHHILPNKTKNLMPYLIADNWLYNYRHINGIQRVLNGMNRRTKYESNMNLATEELQKYYADFEKEFTNFFEEAIAFSSEKLIELNTKL